ncbi:hypothetical protein ABGF48_02360 [Helcococcus bovis]
MKKVILFISILMLFNFFVASKKEENPKPGNPPIIDWFSDYRKY